MYGHLHESFVNYFLLVYLCSALYRIIFILSGQINWCITIVMIHHTPMHQQVWDGAIYSWTLQCQNGSYFLLCLAFWWQLWSYFICILMAIAISKTSIYITPLGVKMRGCQGWDSASNCFMQNNSADLTVPDMHRVLAHGKPPANTRLCQGIIGANWGRQEKARAMG